MEGRGVTNYNVDKPSYAFSTSTTEFDDELMKRDVIQLDQAMMAKGASFQEAQQLANTKLFGVKHHQHTPTDANNDESIDNEKRIDNDNDDIDNELDDDEFLEKYRTMRLSELKIKQQQGKDHSHHGQVIPISRPEWAKEVNDASWHTWVVVTLTSSDTQRTGSVEQAMQELSPKFPNIKFVAIPAQQAIEHWPDANLPSIFLYHHGQCQHQLIKLETNLSVDQVEWKLSRFMTGDEDAMISDLEEEPGSSSSSSRHINNGGSKYRGSSVFGGQMSELQTKETIDEKDNYDDVD